MRWRRRRSPVVEADLVRVSVSAETGHIIELGGALLREDSGRGASVTEPPNSTKPIWSISLCRRCRDRFTKPGYPSANDLCPVCRALGDVA